LNSKSHLTSNELAGAILGLLFTQSSIRTRNSFCRSFIKLGGSVLQSPEIEQRLITRKSNEDLRDVISYYTSYIDILALRTGERSIAELVAGASHVPVVSAGISGQEHPTTALAKAYSIKTKTGRLHGHKVLLVAEHESRSLTSLLNLLPKFGCNEYHILTLEPKAYDKLNSGKVVVFRADKCNLIDLLVHKYSVMIFDESERARNSDRFVDSAKFTFKQYGSQENLEYLAHLKPIIRLFDRDLKYYYDKHGIEESNVSTAMKSAVLYWALEQGKDHSKYI